MKYNKQFVEFHFCSKTLKLINSYEIQREWRSAWCRTRGQPAVPWGCFLSAKQQLNGNWHWCAQWFGREHQQLPPPPLICLTSLWLAAVKLIVVVDLSNVFKPLWTVSFNMNQHFFFQHCCLFVRPWSDAFIYMQIWLSESFPCARCILSCCNKWIFPSWDK